MNKENDLTLEQIRLDAERQKQEQANKEQEETYLGYMHDLFGLTYDDPNVTELAINNLYEYWYERNGQWYSKKNPKVTLEKLNAIAPFLAKSGNKSYNIASTDNTSNLIFSTSFKTTNDRIQLVATPVSKNFSLTIRKPNQTLVPIQSYYDLFMKKDLETLKKQSEETNNKLKNLYSDRDNLLEFLAQAVLAKKTIIISGGTGSGKTTLMKSLMQLIPTDERLITIEDAPELIFKNHKNTISLFYESEESSNANKVTAQSLIKSTLRMKPDRILLAEIRGKESYDFINVISTGHGGSITSLHADSVLQTFTRLIMMINAHQDAKNLAPLQIQQMVLDNIDIVVNIKNIKGTRILNDIYFKEVDLETISQRLKL